MDAPWHYASVKREMLQSSGKGTRPGGISVMGRWKSWPTWSSYLISVSGELFSVQDPPCLGRVCSSCRNNGVNERWYNHSPIRRSMTPEGFLAAYRLSGSPKNIWKGLWNGVSGFKKQKCTPKNTRDTPSRMRDREWRFLTAVKVSQTACTRPARQSDAATLKCSQSYALTVLGSRCHADQDRTNERL